MILLAGASVAGPDGVLESATVVIDGDSVGDVTAGAVRGGAGDSTIDLSGHLVVPGFVDVHVHGVEAHDVLDPVAPIAEISRRLTKYGVTAFAPTTVACSPGELAVVFAAIRQLRAAPRPDGARVLPAHLESNFLNPDFKGAQPLGCLRLSPSVGGGVPGGAAPEPGAAYSGGDVLDTIITWRTEVGIVTLAPEMDGALWLVRELISRGIRVSLGHSGASYDEALAGIEAGARHATHLFNRMPPLNHRAPGLVGAVLSRDEVEAEIVCDGYHVHPAVVHAAIAAKTPRAVMAITDGTGASGLPVGATASLGGRRITARDTAAFLDDGTLAGSTLTMDKAFSMLVRRAGFSAADAAVMCATTPARALGLARQGAIAPGRWADLAVLDSNLRVVQTWVGGRPVFDALAGQVGRD